MFAKKLKRFRKNANLSTEDLAKKLNVAKGKINAWEQGLSMPNFEELTVLSIILNISKDELLKDDTLDTNFSYYTKEKPKSKHIKKHNLVLIAITMIAFAGLISLFIFSYVDSFNSSQNHFIKMFSNFKTYYAQFIIFRTTFYISSILLILSVISLFLPDKYLEKIFPASNQKKF